MIMSAIMKLSTILTRFFTQRLIQQKRASPHTISSYRDTFRLILEYAKKSLHKEPSNLLISDIDATFVDEFLNHLEKDRGIKTTSRNLRLTAIRSFFRYAAYELPECAEQIQRVLAIPSKRCQKPQVSYLSRDEADALIASPDLSSWSGRRDHAWLLLAIQTGLRVSELTALTRNDLNLDTGAYVHVFGKGRKERCTPLTKETRLVMKSWIQEIPKDEEQILFPAVRGGRLSSDGIQYLLNKHKKIASERCQSLRNKRVFPHILRHTMAMELLRAGIDISIIAMWLGHESIETTHIYLEADLAMKEKALAKTSPHKGNDCLDKFKPDDQLLAFLKDL